MESPKENRLHKVLHLHFDKEKENEIWLTSSRTLRVLVGIAGMALPLLLWLGLLLYNHLAHPLESISHYYYTRVNSIFIIVVSLLAIFLMVYKGHKPIDFYLSFIAGIGALCVLLFPTGNLAHCCCDQNRSVALTYMPENDFSAFREKFHYASAAVFLLCLAVMSLFLFTKSDKKGERKGSRKKTRNAIYITCGIMMILAMLVAFAGYIGIIKEPFYSDHHLTFWMETTAIEFFGFSWLVKGETLFKDKTPSEPLLFDPKKSD